MKMKVRGRGDACVHDECVDCAQTSLCDIAMPTIVCLCAYVCVCVFARPQPSVP